VRWLAARDRVHHQIMERGYSDRRGAFVQHYDADVLDASLLLMPLVLFIAGKDPRWRTTLDAIGEELVSDSLVYRYDVEAIALISAAFNLDRALAEPGHPVERRSPILGPRSVVAWRSR
jgi:GH15 family glucan-1,4-alpha-glucosidase